MWYSNTRKGRIFAGLVLGLGILDYTLNLTQWGVSVAYVVILSIITLYVAGNLKVTETFPLGPLSQFKEGSRVPNPNIKTEYSLLFGLYYYILFRLGTWGLYQGVFFWFGLVLGYVMVFDVTLLCTSFVFYILTSFRYFEIVIETLPFICRI